MATTLFHRYPLGDDLSMSKLVMSGLPVSVLRELAKALGMTPLGLAPIVNITGKTLSRRLEAKGKLKQDESERAARLMRVFSRAVVVLRDPDKARSWLNRPLRALAGQSPLSLVATEPGAREVEQVLGRIEHGIFA